MNTEVKPASIRHNFLYLLSGNGFSLVARFVELYLLHHFTPMEDVGRFLLGLGITAPIILFTGLGLQQVQGTDAAGRFSFGHYLGARHTTNAIAMLLTVIIATFFGIGSQTFWVIVLVGLMKCTEHISNGIQGFFYRIEQMKYAACSRAIHGVVAVIFFGVPLVLTGSVVLALLFVSAGYLGIAYFYDLRIARRYTDIRIRFEPQILWRLGVKAFPLAIVAGLNSLNSNIYRYVLVGYLDEAAVGIFGTMSYVIVALNQFCIALSHSAMPRMAKFYEKGNIRTLSHLLFKLVMISVVSGTGAVVATVFFGRFFLSFFAAEMVEYNDVFVIIVLGGSLLFLAAILGDMLVSCQKFAWRAISLAISVLVGLGAAFWMIPRWDIAGAAWATLVSNIVRVIVQAVMMNRSMHQLRNNEPASISVDLLSE